MLLPPPLRIFVQYMFSSNIYDNNLDLHVIFLTSFFFAFPFRRAINNASVKMVLSHIFLAYVNFVVFPFTLVDLKVFNRFADNGYNRCKLNRKLQDVAIQVRKWAQTYRSNPT